MSMRGSSLPPTRVYLCPAEISIGLLNAHSRLLLSLQCRFTICATPTVRYWSKAAQMPASWQIAWAIVRSVLRCRFTSMPARNGNALPPKLSGKKSWAHEKHSAATKWPHFECRGRLPIKNPSPESETV